MDKTVDDSEVGDEEEEDIDGDEGEEEEEEHGEKEEEHGEDEEKKKWKRLSAEQKLYTPEEWVERERMRLERSKCCLKEIWDIYSKLIDPLDTLKGMRLLQELESPGKVSSAPTTFDDNNKETNRTMADNSTEERFSQTMRESAMEMRNILHPAEEKPTEKRISLSEEENAREIMQRRIWRLTKKYGFFHKALVLVKEAAARPFIRIENPRCIDKPGSRHALLQVTRTQKPELRYPEDRPKTIATNKNHELIVNTNFIVDSMEGVEVWTQTVESRSVIVEPAPVQDECPSSRIKEDENLGRTEELFEITDIPLDEDGNPIGKRTGPCHYCARGRYCYGEALREWCGPSINNDTGGEILPLPTSYMLGRGWDPEQFYCCKDYMHMHDDLEKLERKLRTEKEAASTFIDISPGKRYDPKKPSGFPGFMPVKTTVIKPGSKLAEETRGQSTKKEKSKGMANSGFGGIVGGGPGGASEKKAFKKVTKTEKPFKNTNDKTEKHFKGDDAKHKTARDYDDKGKESTGSNASRYREGGFRERATSTQGLEWDPYEIAFGHPRYFKEGEYENPIDKCYKHPLVVLTQTELYDQIYSAQLSGRGSSVISHSTNPVSTPRGTGSKKSVTRGSRKTSITQESRKSSITQESRKTSISQESRRTSITQESRKTSTTQESRKSSIAQRQHSKVPVSPGVHKQTEAQKAKSRGKI